MLELDALQNLFHADRRFKLLVDIGHFIDAPRIDAEIDDAHELRAIPFLAPAFAVDVLEPIRLHVQAKRYLATTVPGHADTLTPASLLALSSQGGLMRANDAARVVGLRTPKLAHYLPLLRELTGTGSRL